MIHTASQTPPFFSPWRFPPPAPLCLRLIYLLAAPCQEGSLAWAVSPGTGVLTAGSRAAVLARAVQGAGQGRSGEMMDFSLFSSCFPSLWGEGLHAAIAWCLTCSCGGSTAPQLCQERLLSAGKLPQVWQRRRHPASPSRGAGAVCAAPTAAQAL